MIKSINYNVDCFTTNPSEGFIYLSKGLNNHHKSEINNIYHINLTGWVNCKTYISMNDNEFQVAYSSHSNYNELEEFVSIVKPCVINSIVIEKIEEMSGKECAENSTQENSTYLFWLQSFKKRGMDILSSIKRK